MLQRNIEIPAKVEFLAKLLGAKIVHCNSRRAGKVFSQGVWVLCPLDALIRGCQRTSAARLT